MWISTPSSAPYFRIHCRVVNTFTPWMDDGRRRTLVDGCGCRYECECVRGLTDWPAMNEGSRERARNVVEVQWSMCGGSHPWTGNQCVIKQDYNEIVKKVWDIILATWCFTRHISERRLWRLYLCNQLVERFLPYFILKLSMSPFNWCMVGWSAPRGYRVTDQNVEGGGCRAARPQCAKQ